MGDLLRMQRKLLHTAKELSADGYTPVELREAIPYIQKFQGCTMVVKVGGSVLEDETNDHGTFFKDLAFMANIGARMILVHGGSRQLSQRMKAENIEVDINNGVRRTNLRVLRLAVEEFNKLNKRITRCIKAAGGKAIPFPAGKSDIVQAERKSADPDDFVGRVTGVTTDRLTALKDKYIPLITCLGSGSDGTLFNINADEVAAAIAKALKAEKLILLTDVDGVKDADGKLISTLTMRQTHELLASKVIIKGMIPKVKTCIDALNAGVGKAHIINGNKSGALLSEVLTDGGIGTEIVMTKKSLVRRSA